MRCFNHDELHNLFEKDPALKKRSDYLHTIPTSDDLGSWFQTMEQTLNLFVDAVGCKNQASAHKCFQEICNHIRSICNSRKEWVEKAKLLSRSKRKIKQILRKFERNRKCHNSGGDYICYCDEHFH